MLSLVTVHSENYIIAFHRDITERKLAEVALKNSQNQISALLNAIPDMMFIQNTEGVYLDYYAPKNTNLFVSPEVFIGKNMKDVLPENIVKDFKIVFDKAFQTKTVQFYEYSLLVDNRLGYYEGRIIVFENNKVLSIIRDITRPQKGRASFKRE